MDANPSTLRARSLRQRFAHSRNATTTSASLMTRPVDPKFNLMGRELLTLSTCLNARSFDGNTRTDGGSSTTGAFTPSFSPNLISLRDRFEREYPLNYTCYIISRMTEPFRVCDLRELKYCLILSQEDTIHKHCNFSEHFKCLS